MYIANPRKRRQEQQWQPTAGGEVYVNCIVFQTPMSHHLGPGGGGESRPTPGPVQHQERPHAGGSKGPGDVWKESQMKLAKEENQGMLAPMCNRLR